jgi:putative ABC transport system permease protein
MKDIVHAIRLLGGSPAYALVVLLTLALGIGANAALFAAVDTLLMRSLPYPNGDRLVVPTSVHVARGIDNGSVSFGDYEDWRRHSDVFEAVGLWRPMNVDLTGAGEPERVQAIQASPGFFDALAVTPIAGRVLVESDHQPRAPYVAVITHALWQRSFGAGPDAIGRTVRVGGVPHEIVGILPSRQSWPDSAALFVPMRPAQLNDDMRTRRDNMVFGSVALLREGVSLDRGNAVLATIAAGLEQQYPGARGGWTNRLVPMRDFMIEATVRQALWVLLAAVAAVLLIACANLAHIGLVRGLGRSREMSVRLALGATRWRLIRHLSAESLVLAAPGAVGGIIAARWMIDGLAAMAPPGTPFVDDLRLDGRVALFAAFVTSVVIALTGIVPALLATQTRPGTALKDGAPGAGTSRRVALLRSTLIAGEVAGAVVLVIAAAVLARSFWTLQHVDPGVDLDRVLAGRLALPRSPDYSDSARITAFFHDLSTRLAALPGVESAAATSYVPIGGGGIGLGRVFLEESWPEPPAHADVGAQWNVVTPAYFRTVGIPVLQGRSFSTDDRADSTPVTIVSRSFARQMFGDGNPIGRRVRSWRDENVLRQIVGVVGDVRYTGLAERETLRQVYVPHSQNSWGLMNLVVRARSGAADALAPSLRETVRAADANLALSHVTTLRGLASDSVAAERYLALLLSILAATALALGAIGIYGVVSHAVSLRTRELGVRAALGASSRDLSALVVRQVLLVTAIGAAIGVAAALAVSRGLEALLYETEPRDPSVYTVTIVVIALVALAACLGPARRAATVDPVACLRA